MLAAEVEAAAIPTRLRVVRCGPRHMGRGSSGRHIGVLHAAWQDEPRIDALP